MHKQWVCFIVSAHSYWQTFSCLQRFLWRWCLVLVKWSFVHVT